MSDGGDGFGEVLGHALGAARRTLSSVDAAHRPCTVHWWWEAKTRTAVLESAAVIGLAMLPPGRFHPFELDTLGLGVALETLARCGARRCLLGIGGSATNDAGFGMARALGWEFLDESGSRLERWTELPILACIRPAVHNRWFEELLVAVDVSNPLLGPRGATRIYGLQKGLRPRDFAPAERCLRRLARLYGSADLRSAVSRTSGPQPGVRTRGSAIARIAGAGAAGGLGFGLVAFAGARLESGFALFAKLAHLERHLDWADLVITGEGAIDRSTIMGKGVGQVASRCREGGTPCIGLGGIVNRANVGTFTELHGLTDLVDEAEAKAHPAVWLTRLAQKLASSI